MFKWSCDFMVTVDHHIAIFGGFLGKMLAMLNGQRPCGSRYITYLICHVTSYDHVLRSLCEFIRGSSLLLLTTLRSLMAIGLMVVQI